MHADTVLVTGGSRGIGRMIVRRLVERGATVAFTYASDAAAARETAQACGERARAFPLDLADRAAPDELVRRIEGELGPLSGLVNNAGLLREALLALTSDEEWDAVLDINLGGAFRCCRAVLPGMVSRRRGAIVNVASLSAVRGLPGQAAYAASKAGLVGLTRSLAREVGKRGIRANAVLPGLIATDLAAGLSDDRVRALRAGECLPAGVDAGTVAGTVAFLLSADAAAITGQAILVDAGTMA